MPPRVRFADKNTPPPKLTWPFIQRILSYFRPFGVQMCLLIAIIAATSLLGLVPPMLLQKIVDEALKNENMPQLVTFVLLSVGATVLLNLIQVAQGYLSTWIAKRITFDLKNTLYDKLTRMPQSFFASAKPGDITTRLNSDIDGIQSVFSTTVVNFISSFLVLGTTLAALFSLNPTLALVGMITVPLFILPTRKVGQIRWQITSESQENLSELNQHIQESLSTSGSTLMKLFTNEERANQSFSEINDKVTRLQIREALAGRWFRMAMSVFTTIGPMLVYLVGGYLLTKNQITIGGIVAFATLLTRLYNPVIQLSNIQVDFMRSFALFQRIFDYLDLQPAITEKTDAEDMTFETGEIIFDNVNFNYENEPALRNINLTIPAGKMTALVGSSGAGKSTLTSLITRIQDPTTGEVSIDGHNIQDLTLKSLRSQIGVVTQEAYLFNGTIRDNLLYGNESADDAALIAACKAAYIHDFIMTLPKGYDTEVGNRGIKLSGGEKQRLAIARVILKDPKILILDEATSALDAISERYVQMAMEDLLKDRTSIVIAHRLSTIRQADQIIVMNKGQIVEQGSHLDLLKQKGAYYDLHTTQYDKTSA